MRTRLPGSLPLQQIQEGAQLQAGDIGPAAAVLHRLQQLVEAVAVFGETVAESAILDGAVQLFEPPQQIQQGGRIAFEAFG